MQDLKRLLYKEWKLCMHPAVYFFFLMGAMLLIPSYPYFVPFFYACLGIFFIFLQGRENRDLHFSALLPIEKGDAVRGRVLLVVIIEVLQIISSIPFAVLGAKINPNPEGNLAGMEANIAFYAFVFLLYALFNLLYLPRFYRSGYKVGKSLLWALSFVLLYAVAVEVAVALVPALKFSLDTLDPALQLRQIPLLLGSMLLYGVFSVQACRLSIRNYRRVDL